MRRLFLATAALSVLLSSFAAANAADLKMAVKAPPPPLPVPFSWTGCYVGVNGGGIWSHHEFTVVNGPADGSIDINGGLIGVQGGCNYQTSNWVFGIQGDWDWADFSGNFRDTAFANLTDGVHTHSLASVTGRIGYAWDRFLLYAKGGGAWETIDFTANGTSFSTISDTRSGWTFGVGGEYAFLDWLSGFVEYDWYDFGTRSETMAPFSGVVSFNVKETQSVLKGGLNFRFWGLGGGAAAPAPAVRTKY